MTTNIEAPSQGGATLAPPDGDLPSEVLPQPAMAHPMPQETATDPVGVAAVAAVAAIAVQSNIGRNLLATPDSALDALTFGRQAAKVHAPAGQHPLVEPIDSFNAYLRDNLYMPKVRGPVITLAGQLPKRVDHRAWQSDFRVSQGGRGTCSAFAGCAALEAAYARQGTRVKLSEHNLFHISKSHEN